MNANPGRSFKPRSAALELRHRYEVVVKAVPRFKPSSKEFSSSSWVVRSKKHLDETDSVRTFT